MSAVVVALAVLLALSGLLLAQRASADQGPVAAYSFDAGEGEVAEDLVGENDGAIEGAEWFDNGRFGKALLFDGEETCVTVPHHADLQLDEEMTVEAWVKPHSLSDQPIIYKSAWGNLGYALGISLFNYGKPEGFIGEGVGKFEDVVSPEAVDKNAWVHVAFTYDGATMRLYVNSSLVATQVQSTPPPTGEGPLAIGCNPLYPEDFDGLIDEVRIYNRALSVGEISADAGTGLQELAADPVAAYSFDEGEGAVAHDLFGEHDGTLEGASWFGNGRFGKVLSFDGENDCVTIPNAPELQLTEDFTLEAWVKPEGAVKYDPVLFKETEGFFSYFLGLGVASNGKVEGYIGDEEEEHTLAVSPEPVPSNAWSHVSFTYDGARLRLYVNGELVDTTLTGVGNMPSSGPLQIGCADIFNEYFKGLIDEVRIYNRALSAGELAGDAGAGLQTPSRTPVAAYSFDAGEGEVAEDLFGEHDGELNNVDWVNGKYGGSLYFDGNGDYVEIPDSVELQLGEDFTLEAWVRPDAVEDEGAVISKTAGNFFSYQLYAGSREFAGIPEGFLGYEPWAWDDVEDENPLEAKTWNHLALTYDGSRQRLYVNGELVDISVEPTDPGMASVGPLYIGGNEDEEDFKGRIDEVRIYNRARGAGELSNFRDRTPPNNVKASGELAALDSQYINGRESKTVVVSAADNSSGIRSLALEDEGRGFLASYGPANCVWVSSHEKRCPREAARTLMVPTARMPEGANHLRVVAEDLAGNVAYGESFTVYVDRTAPGVASALEALREPEEEVVDITWAEAPDPLLPEGTRGSGASIYEYRYKVGEGAWSALATSQSREFSIPIVANGTSISAEITATDLVGNRGEAVVLSDTVGEAAAFNMEEPGVSTGENLNEIGFSNAPEPEDPSWPGPQSQLQAVEGPITPAAAFEEDNCPGESPCGTYNGKEAAAYARYWHSRRNGAYNQFGNDCVNFVNQALFAGNMRFVRTDGHNNPKPSAQAFLDHYHTGEGSWWSAKIEQGEYVAPIFHWTESWSLVVKARERIGDYKLGYALGPSARIKKGDIVFYRFKDENGDFHSDRPWTHVSLVSNITKKGIWVAQHTTDYERLLGDVYLKLNKEYGPVGKDWFIQFVRPTKTTYDIE